LNRGWEFRGEKTEEANQEEPVPAGAAGGNPGKGKKGSE
jgi:hypothetical protein